MEMIKSYNICLLGRTGNGKSSLINAMFGTNFPTNPLVACTKEMYSVTVLEKRNEEEEGITVYDTPGIGEFSSDSKYERYYQHVAQVADCVVLVTTFDRTDAPAQRLIKRIKSYVPEGKNVKFVVALNHIDSKIITDNDGCYEPWNEELNVPSDACFENIKTRVSIIHDKFDNKFIPFEVVPVCASRGYGIEKLKEIILK